MRVLAAAVALGLVTGGVWATNGSTSHAATGAGLIAFACTLFGAVVAGGRA